MTESSTNPADRRTYFRIDDQVGLRFRVIGEDELPSMIERLEKGCPDTISLASAFSKTNSDLRQSMDRCKRVLPDVAQVLTGLNNKIDLLVHLLAALDNDLPDRPTHDVNVSASGMRFNSPKDFASGTLLEVKLLFFPSFICLLTIATVVRSIPNPNSASAYPFETAVEFTYIREADRELLIKHVLEKESTMLRKMRDALSDVLSDAG